MNIIASYTRAEAIEDGVLIDVSDTAKEAGFKVPVAITKNVWVDCVQWTEETESRKDAIQDEEGRLWDVLLVAFLAARLGGGGSCRLFDLHRVPVQGRGVCPRRVTLAMIMGPGDSGEPVVTITMPNED